MSPAFPVWSSVMAVKVGRDGRRASGASLTSETAMEAVSVLLEKAVVPPGDRGVDLGALRVRRRCWSQAFQVTVGSTVSPLSDRPGTKRRLSPSAEEQRTGVGDDPHGQPAAAHVVLPGTAPRWSGP